jgi:hypothetical protein
MRFDKHTTFSSVPIGTSFQMNRTMRNPPVEPTTWVKVSTRTARVHGTGPVFFFRKAETVWVRGSD